jgi:hypothetical protein
VIEQAMIFALGFLVASLLSLLFLPILSRRAIRLATRRLQMLVPLSMNEIMAERDQIRAEHAAAARRLEQKIEHLTQKMAEAMSEAGRLSGRLFVLQDEHAAALERNALLTAERDEIRLDAYDARATLGLQMQLLHDALGSAERWLAILRGTEARLASAEALIDVQKASIEAMETRTTRQDLRIRSLVSQAAKMAEDLARARTAAAVLTSERDIARAHGSLLAGKFDRLEHDLDAAQARPSGDEELAVLREAIASLAAELLHLMEPRSVAAEKAEADG